MSAYNHLRRVETRSKEERIAAAESVCGYNFANQDLLWEALQLAGSGVRVDGRILVQGNKPLANVGDAVISLLIRSRALDRFWKIGRCCCNMQQ